MEAEAEAEAPVVVLIHSQPLKVRIASEESAAVAVRAVPAAVVAALGLRAVAPSESSSRDLLPRFPITPSSAAQAATAVQVELVQRVATTATAEPVDRVRSSAPAVRVAAATVEKVVPDPAVAVGQVA
jgi:hypothetical protein